jgi:hypothetical protein
MFEPDENFLEDVGLQELGSDFRAAFLGYVYDHLERRVGESLSENMSNDQLAEFEAIIDGRDDVIDDWIAQNAPSYAEDDLYYKIMESTGADGRAARGEYAATKWLAINRPDYRSIVQAKLAEIRQFVREYRDQILDVTRS